MCKGSILGSAIFMMALKKHGLLIWNYYLNFSDKFRKFIKSQIQEDFQRSQPFDTKAGIKQIFKLNRYL